MTSPFIYSRTVYLADTDAAGVIYFAQLLSICHEAYENSLLETGIRLQTWLETKEVAIPITHAAIDLRRPIVCGEQLLIAVKPEILNESSFQVIYQVSRADGSLLAEAETKHVAIAPLTRSKIPLPTAISSWLQLRSS